MRPSSFYTRIGPHLPHLPDSSGSYSLQVSGTTVTHSHRDVTPQTQSQYLVSDEGQPHALQLAPGLAEDKMVLLGLGDDEVELDLLS